MTLAPQGRGEPPLPPPRQKLVEHYLWVRASVAHDGHMIVLHQIMSCRIGVPVPGVQLLLNCRRLRIDVVMILNVGVTQC